MRTEVEFVNWPHIPGFVRCLACGALGVSGDVETHLAWHQTLDERIGAK